eukprot:392674-Rhodomonas_salina.2
MAVTASYKSTILRNRHSALNARSSESARVSSKIKKLPIVIIWTQPFLSLCRIEGRRGYFRTVTTVRRLAVLPDTEENPPAYHQVPFSATSTLVLLVGWFGKLSTSAQPKFAGG